MEFKKSSKRQHYYLTYFETNNIQISDIIANKHCLLIIDSLNNVYFMGKSDLLFDGKIVSNPIKIDSFSNSISQISYNICNSTIAAVSETCVQKCFPSIIANNGKTKLQISGGNTFYKTNFNPKIKFCIGNSEMVQNAEWEQSETNDNDLIALTVFSPNLNHLRESETSKKYKKDPFEFPCQVSLYVSLDGAIFSPEFNIFAVEIPECGFQMAPQCGDAKLGGLQIKLLLNDENYCFQLRKHGIRINNMKVYLQNSQNSET